jgi:tetratricopeptide (TPR) repeat protein
LLASYFDKQNHFKPSHREDQTAKNTTVEFRNRKNKGMKKGRRKVSIPRRRPDRAASLVLEQAVAKFDQRGQEVEIQFNAETLNIGPDKEWIRRVFREEAAQIAGEKGIPLASLQAALKTFGEIGVREEDIPTRLEAAANELVGLRAENDLLKKGPPQIAAIADEVQALIDKGDFDTARASLSRGREVARKKFREESSRYEAQLLAQEARVDHLQLDYRSAAAKYAEAASLVASFDAESRKKWLLAQAREFYDQGNEFGDNAAFADAVSLYRQCLDLASRARVPLQWSMTQNNLGNALLALGSRESGTARLEEAVAVYREALKECPREREPVDWAATQNNLGNALRVLGSRESGTARLEEAVAAYHEALKEQTRERVPLRWSMTQNNLGNALFRLGERESGTARLEEAVAAYHKALEERTQKRVPLDWAGTQHNLGSALFRLGERESGTARLAEAVAAFHKALEERTQKRVPLQWAGTQNNLGNALRVLGERESGTARLEEAVAAYHEALKEQTR